MKKAYIYLTCIGMAVLAVACSKNESQLDPTKPEVPKEANIGFGSAIAKAPDAIVADESKLLQVRVYDYYTASDVETEYIKDLIQEATTEGAWAFVSEQEYAWKKGAHKFFGWVEIDESGTDVHNLSYTNTNKVLSVGTAAAPVAAADYRYSEITAVNWPDNNMIEVVDGKSVAKSVKLNVKHLTSALTFSVKDYSYNGDVLINSVSVGDVKTKGSATVDYSGATQAVTYSLGDETGAIAFPLPDTTPFTRESEDDPYIFDGDTTCVWPQTFEGLKLTVKYTAGGSQKTVTVDVPDGEWEAGKVYNFDLQIVNKGIELTFTVLPWESVAVGTIDTSVGSINMTNVTWMNTKLFVNGELKNTLNNSAYSVFMYKDGYLPKVDGNGEVITEKYTEEVTETYQEDVYDTYAETVYDLYTEDVYDTYLEDVIDPDTGEVIHAAGEVKVYEETILDPDTGNPIQTAGDPIILHKKGDKKLDENNNPIILHEAGEIKTYEADVKDPETGEIIHHAGDQILLHEAGTPVLDEYGRPIVHHVGDVKYGPDGEPIYQVGEKKEGYCPAQGFFTVNYPKEGLFKIDLIPAYGQSEADLDKSKYDIYIYDYPTETAGGTFRSINPDGEPISNNTVYFQVRAADGQDGAEYKAQINIWFKFAEYDEETEKWVIPEDAEWISAYSEIRANYALIIPATN